MSARRNGTTQPSFTDGPQQQHAINSQTQPNRRGRPPISTQRARDNSKARGAIEAYVTPKTKIATSKGSRKRAAGSSSPEEKLANYNPAKKTNDKVSPIQSTQFNHPHKAQSPDQTDPAAMDKLLAEIRGMRDENSKQFANMSKQLEDSAAAHDMKLTELAKEFQSYKEDNERTTKNLQNQILALQEETRESTVALTERVKTAEARLDNSVPAQAQALAHNTETLLDKIEELEKESKKLNLVFKGLDTSRGSAKAVADSFITEEFALQNAIVEARYLPARDTQAKTRRAIVVKLDSLESKQAILAQKANLKGRNIFIDIDLTARQGKAAKALRDAGKQLKADGHTIKHGNQGLQIDGIWHYWSIKDNALKVSSRSSSTATSAASSGTSSRAESLPSVTDSEPKN